MELELVQELRRISAHEEEKTRGALRGELCRPRKVEPPREPHRVVREVLHEHRPALGDGAVAETALFDGQLRARVREMLCVTGLVEESAPVVRPPDRLDDEHDLARYLDRGAERARRLVRPLLDIETDVLLRVQIDAQLAECRLECRQHLVGRENRVPLRRAEHARHVPSLRLREAHADAGPQRLVRRVFVHGVRRIEECATLSGQVVELVVELVVEVAIALGAELERGRVRFLMRLEQERIEVFVCELVPNALDPRAAIAVGAVGDRRTKHAKRNLVTVDGRRQLGLQCRHLLLMTSRQCAEIALAREAPQLDRAEAAVDRLAHPARLVERRDVLVPPVHRFEVEVLIETGEVVVVHLVEVGDETVDALAVCVQLARSRYGHRA